MHGHHHLFHFMKNKELTELYATIALRSFAIALSGVFIPIYLYQLGYPLASIFLFFGLAALFNLVSLFPTAKLSARWGLKHSILFSVPFLLVFFLLLFSLEQIRWPLALLAFFGGIQGSLFWFPYHTEFSKFSNKKKRGSQVGVAKVIGAVFSAAGPLLGGVILALFGFKILFSIVSLLLIISVFPLFLTKDFHEPAGFSFQGFMKGHKLKNVLAYMGNGIEIRIATIIWPLFIFIFILNEQYVSLGTVATIAFSFSLLSTFVISRFSDLNRKLTLKVGTIGNSIVWIAKSFVVTPFQVFVADAFYGITQTTINLPFDALSYDKAKKNERTRMILERELYIKLGAILFLIIAALTVDKFIEIFRYGGPLASLLQFLF